MVDSKQDRLAKEVVELSISFKMALSNKRKYPMAQPLSPANITYFKS